MTHLSLHVSAFTKADESPVADDDMVEDGDFHDLAGIGNALGDDDVLVARFRVPRRVVVDQDDGCRIVTQGLAEDFPRLGQTGIDRADSQSPIGDELVLRR